MTTAAVCLNRKNDTIGLTILLALLAMLALIPSAARGADLDRQIRFDIPAQALSLALAAFSRQADTNVVATTDITNGKMSNAVNETTTPTKALQRLLDGTNLQYRLDKDGAIVITERTPPATDGKHGSVRKTGLLRLAQSDGTSAAVATDSVETNAAQPSEGRVEISEVIVTATKRVERLQDVPLSIAVVTADDINRRGLVHSEDYLRGIPGVNQLEGLLGQAIVIRGIETQVASQNYNSGPTTATYFGETATTNSGGMNASSIDVKLVDIERVEVLRGPQGTAFGNSSVGGAVRVVPAAPRLGRFEGKVAAGYSQTSGFGGDNDMFQAVVNVPLIADRLAIRGVAYRFEDSGFYRNRAGSDAAYQADFVVPEAAQPFATDEDEVGTYRAEGGRLALLFQATDALRLKMNFLNQKTENDGFGMQTSGDYTQTLLRVAPEHVRRNQPEGVNDFRLRIVNPVVEYDLGWADLVATYSNVDGEALSVAPYGKQGIYTLPWAASAHRDLGHDEDVTELRLATRLGGAWDFLVGLYHEKQSSTQAVDVVWHGGENPFPGRTGIYDYFERRVLKQNAAFGEVSWRFAPRFTLTGGVRFFDYERSVSTDTSGYLLQSESHQLNEADESDSIFRANLSYKLSDRALVYGGWSQGFRLGKPQEPPPASVCDPDGDGIIDGTNYSMAAAGRVKSDSLNNYEIGTRFSTDRGLTLDGAIFRMDWVDIPVTIGLPCSWPYLANAGDARSEGIELQGSIRLTDSLRATFGGARINARLTRDAPGIGARAGARLANAPKLNANLGLHYEFTLGGHPTYVRADGIYVGTYYGDVLERPQDRAGGYVKVDASARVMVNAFYLDLYVHNLTDEDAFTYKGYNPSTPLNGYRMRPRTVGLQFGFDF
jgi:iron complex outermembrane receptor protein